MSEKQLRTWIVFTVCAVAVFTACQVFFARRAVEALPPKDFLTQFQVLFAAAHATQVAAHAGALRADELEEHARNTLQRLADAVREFLKKPAKARFSANVMLYRNQDHVKKNAALLQKNLKFVDQGVNVESLPRGVLELARLLSAEMSNRPAGAAATQLPALVLPVHAKLDRALPGAPEAFHLRTSCVYYEDTRRIGERCRDKGISAEVAEEVDNYFRKNLVGVRSIFSVALIRTRDVDVPGKQPFDPLGVVNVNCSEPRMLKSERQQEMLMPHVTMITYLLAEIIDAFLSKDFR